MKNSITSCQILKKLILKYFMWMLMMQSMLSMTYAQTFPNECIDFCGFGTTYYGYNAGANTVVSGNSIFGGNAGIFNTTGTRNCFFGQQSGINSTFGNDNCFFGDNSGANNTTGEKNIYIGQAAGTNIHTGIRNICIGFRSGPELGNEDIDDRLFIDVVKTNTPLIYGEFDNDHLVVNGTFEVTAGLSNPSSKQLKTDFTKVDVNDILKKISTLSIEKWVYKTREDEKHIGPIAEEFYELFGLGKDNTQISTIDSDGVALAAIQALKAENDELKNRIEKLEKLMPCEPE